jgi:hypothetical protein
VACVGVGRPDSYYDRIYMHLRGHSSAAKRRLKAVQYVILVCILRGASQRCGSLGSTRCTNRLSTEGGPGPCRGGLPASTRRGVGLWRKEPAAAARYVKLIGASLTGASACVAPAPIGDSSVKGTAPEAYVDKPPPPPIRQLRSRGVSIPRVDAPELSSRKYTRIPGYIV